MYIPNSSIAAMICSTQMSLGTEEVACCFSLNIDGHGVGGSGVCVIPLSKVRDTRRTSVKS